MMTISRLPRRAGAHGRTRSRGQIAVIFALSITLFVALCALVVDISFYWVSTLQAQRAADAAALAGAVYLPGDPVTAYKEARDSATQNGYTAGGPANVVITTVQDAGDSRQLDVTISASVPTFFARVVGISSFPVTRTAKGVYVLPVPMGSPLAYYGVGEFSANKLTTTTTTSTSTADGFSSCGTGTWSSSCVGDTAADGASTGWTASSGGIESALTNNDNHYARTSTNGAVGQWTGFGLLSGLAGNQTVTAVSGIEVRLTDAFLSQGCSGSTIGVQLSWNGGTTFQTMISTPNLGTTNTTDYNLGSSSATNVWGAHTWTQANLADGKFVVRLTATKGSTCAGALDTKTINVDMLAVRVHWTVATTTTTTTTTAALQTTSGVTDPDNLFLNSQGSWGALLTKGGNQENGDAYAPANNGSNPNINYDASGFAYAVQLPSGGQVRMFDPGFCAMGSNGAAGSMGAGDHWIGTSGTPVSTYYTLWDTHGKLGLPAAWTKTYTSGALFEGQTGFDPENTAPNVASGSGPSGATSGCDPYHNAWWTMPTGSLPAGTYVLQVQTSKTNPPSSSTDPSVNNGTNAENMWSIEVVGGGTPQVYGNGRMTVYNNIQAGTQQFYLAKIDQATGAGKTALIDLFDPGDLGGSASGTLQVLSPDGGTPHVVNFDYTTDANCVVRTGTSPCSGTNVDKIITTWNGAQATNNTWIHISIPLPNTYGQPPGGLWKGGWWQIQYIVTGGGNDTTTWQVSVQGNPVHLLVP